MIKPVKKVKLSKKKVKEIENKIKYINENY